MYSSISINNRLSELKYSFSEILWYKDDKVIRTDDHQVIENEDNKTICRIANATKTSEGVYMCKAVSDIGMAITKAKLQVFKAGEKIKKLKAKEIKEKVKAEKAMKRGKDVVEKDAAKEVVENLDVTTVTEVQAIEATKSIKKVSKEKAQVILTEAEHIETVDVASYKKSDKKPVDIPKSEKLEPILTPHDYIISSQQQKEESAEPFDQTFDMQTGIIKMVEGDTLMAIEVNDILEVINAKEFGPGESPLRELAKIGYMLRKGVSIEQIEGLYDSEYFPALRVPQSQSALVRLVERQGHGALITEVLTEETAQDENILAAKAGFRAFLKMVELKHNSVEEVIAHLYPEDFIPRSWEQKEAQEVIIVLSISVISQLFICSRCFLHRHYLHP